MDLSQIISLAVTAFTIGFVTFVGFWSKRKPNRDASYGGALRQPKVTAFIGWMVLVIGVLLLLTSLAGGSKPNDRVPMLVCGIVLALTGALLVTIYRNWRLIVRDDEIEMRTTLGRTKVIRYDGIAGYSFSSSYNVRTLTLRGTDGAVIHVNVGAFDVTPVLEAIETFERYGRWPHEAARAEA